MLDCTGVFTTANWLGHGGIPAIGEVALHEQIEYRLPDILGRDRMRYAGKHTLLIGGGMSAATNALALAELATSDPQMRVTWITRREGAAGSGGPIAVIENDPLPERAARMARRANQLAAGGGSVAYWPRTVVEKVTGRLTPPARRFAVELSGEHAETIEVDEIIANVGFRPDSRIDQELQFQEGYTTEGPIKPEPNFYILGAQELRPPFGLLAANRLSADSRRFQAHRRPRDARPVCERRQSRAVKAEH